MDHNHTHLFTYCLWLFLCAVKAELRSCNTDPMTYKPKIFIIWLFTGKVDQSQHTKLLTSCNQHLLIIYLHWNLFNIYSTDNEWTFRSVLLFFIYK